MKKPTTPQGRKKVVKAWASFAFGKLCHHENSLSIYKTQKDAKKEVIAKDGMTMCTGDKIIPCTITYTLPSKKK